MNIETALHDACAKVGIIFKQVPLDGRFHRADVADDPHGKNDGAIKLFPDGQGGIVANWKGGEPLPFFIDYGKGLSATERVERDRKRKEAIEEARAEEKRRQEEAARVAADIWGKATPATANHAYLTKKGVKSYGLKLHNGKLIIPLRNGAALQSIQSIAPDGGKLFLKGGRKQGCYYSFGGDPLKAGVLCIAEGYATAASVHEATGYPLAVAFDAENLKPVAEALRVKFPEARIILCTDDDHETEGNPGLTKATQAARAINGLLAVPSFGKVRHEKSTDFNDLHQLKGLAAVKECLAAAQDPPMQGLSPTQGNQHNANREDQDEGNGASSRLTVISAMDFMAFEFPPRENILAPWLPRQGLAMVHAPRGIGKTHFSLGVAYAVASGGKLFGWEATKPRGVLFIDGEMPATVLQERLARIAGSSDRDLAAPFHIINPDLQTSGMIDLTRPQDHLELAPYLEGVDLIVIDNLSTLCRTGKENEAESWIPVQGWALQQRAAGKSVLFIHHSGKNGEQRGTSKREDVLDTVIALKRPGDYTPEKGCCFEVHFEKARGIFGDDVKPFEAQLITTGDKQEWLTRTLEQSTAEKVAALLNDGLSQVEIAEELEMTKSAISKARKKAGALGLLKRVS